MDWKKMKERSGERERVKWCLDFNPEYIDPTCLEAQKHFLTGYFSTEWKSKLRRSKPKHVVLKAGLKTQLWSSWTAWSRHRNLKLTALKDRSGPLRISGQAHYTDREEKRQTFTMHIHTETLADDWDHTLRLSLLGQQSSIRYMKIK